MVESATNKLLHAPTTRLRRAAGDGDAQELAAVIKELFELPTLEAIEEESDESEPPALQ
jgi:glutamyl-tRNA reductase